MELVERQGRGWTLVKISAVVGLGIVALVLLFPASGNSRQPPECYSVFGYSVPCGAEVAVVAAVLAAGTSALLLFLLDRRGSASVDTTA